MATRPAPTVADVFTFSGGLVARMEADTGPAQAFAAHSGHVPGRRLACHPDVDVHPVLGRLALRHLEKADGWAHTGRIDDGSTVWIVVTRLSHIPERARPERSKPMRVSRIVTGRPMCRHFGTVPPCAVIKQIRSTPVRPPASVYDQTHEVWPPGDGCVRTCTSCPRSHHTDCGMRKA
jgi:hypothetical protein